MKRNTIKCLICAIGLCVSVSFIGGCATTDARFIADLVGTAADLAGDAYMMKKQHDYQKKALKQQKKYMEKVFKAF